MATWESNYNRDGVPTSSDNYGSLQQPTDRYLAVLFASYAYPQPNLVPETTSKHLQWPEIAVTKRRASVQRSFTENEPAVKKIKTKNEPPIVKIKTEQGAGDGDLVRGSRTGCSSAYNRIQHVDG
jgi:hypothetical protein